MKTFLSLLLSLLAIVAGAQNAGFEPMLEQAQEDHLRGNHQSAIVRLNQIIHDYPGMAAAYSLRGESKAASGDFEGALTDFSIAVDLRPEDFDARLGRAHAFFKLSRFDEARSDYLRLLSLDPGETSTVYFQRSASPSGTMQITTAQSGLNHLVMNHIGLCELQSGRPAAALQWLDSAINLNSREADYWVNRGLVRQKLGDPKALGDFEDALRIDPANTAALSALGRQAGAGKRGKYLDDAIDSDTTAVEPYLERAYDRMQAGSYREALADYNRALALKQTDPETWLNRGFVREKTGDLAGAFSDYTKAISLREDYSQAWLNRGNVLQKLGRLQEAVEDYTAALVYDPAYAAAFHNRAIVWQKMKKFSDACDDIRRAEVLGMKVDEKLKAAVCR